MGRPAKVWYRAANNSYYATIGGQKVRLTASGGTRNEAEKRWHDLMARQNAPELQDRNPVKVIAEAFLDHAQVNKPRSYNHYRKFLHSFVDAFPDILVSDLRAVHVQRWLHEHRETWGESTRHAAISVLVACLNWARRPEVALIGSNPIAKMHRGTARSRGEEAVIDPDDYQAVLSAAGPRLRDVLFALRQTGARPSEICRMTAADCRFDHDVVVYERGQTGRPRYIPMTAGLKTLLLALAERHPTGALFRTPTGRAWTPSHLADAVRKARKKAGVKGTFIPYGFRHTAATDMLEAGVPDAKVAAMLGHVNTAMIYKHYGHVKPKSLLADMERVLGGGEANGAQEAGAAGEGAA